MAAYNLTSKQYDDFMQKLGSNYHEVSAPSGLRERALSGFREAHVPSTSHIVDERQDATKSYMSMSPGRDTRFINDWRIPKAKSADPTARAEPVPSGAVAEVTTSDKFVTNKFTKKTTLQINCTIYTNDPNLVAVLKQMKIPETPEPTKKTTAKI